MNAKNVTLMGAAAVVIALCLLFSWVQYGDGSADDPVSENFEGTWYPVYTYGVGDAGIGGLPEVFTVTCDDGTVVMEADGTEVSFVAVSDREAVSENGYDRQLYVEDGILYHIYIHAEGESGGMAYFALSKDASMVLPDDPSSIEGYSADVTVRETDGEEFLGFNITGRLSVDSHALHVATGTVTFGNSPMDFAGFVKSDGDRTVVTGYGMRGGTAYPFSMVVEDGEVMFSAAGSPAGRLTYAGTSAGFTSDLGDGTVSLDTAAGAVEFDVSVEYAMAIVSGPVGYPAAVAWTLGGDLVLFQGWSVLSYDGTGYSFLAQNILK